MEKWQDISSRSGDTWNPHARIDKIQIANWDSKYDAIYDHAWLAAVEIVRCGKRSVLSESGRYIFDECCKLLETTTCGYRLKSVGPVTDALDAIVSAWPSISRGERSGENVFEATGDLWFRLMEEWPMGYYADIVAGELAALELSGKTVVELGAGVGVTTRRIRRMITKHGGQLFATDLRYRGSQAADFDRPLLSQLPTADVVIATNALHCARDPVSTLNWIHQLVRPSGWIVLGEGAPFPRPNLPWALNLLFGACRGWYDGSGFRSPSFWLSALRTAGFVSVKRTRWPSDRYELGGAYIARV